MAESAPEQTISRTVRDGDPDRYLATLFAPAPVRGALMALYAFNIDVARIPEAVSEPMLGEIRLQWWRDALATLERGGETGNPVADALGRAMRDHRLPKALLLGVIDARTFDLSGELMPDAQALKAYLQKTGGNLFAAAMRILDASQVPIVADGLTRDAGHVWGMTGLLRALPLHLARGRFYLPASRFHDYGSDPEALLRGEADDKARATLAGLRAETREAWNGLRRQVNEIAPPARTAFLPLALVPAYLRALEKQADTPLGNVAEISPLTRISRLLWAASRGRV